MLCRNKRCCFEETKISFGRVGIKWWSKFELGDVGSRRRLREKLNLLDDGVVGAADDGGHNNKTAKKKKKKKKKKKR